MRVEGRIDKHSVSVLLDNPEIEWHWECPACGTESYSMRSDWEHDAARIHAEVCDSLRLQRLLDDLDRLGTCFNDLARSDFDYADAMGSRWTEGRGVGLMRAYCDLGDLLARHRGAS